MSKIYKVAQAFQKKLILASTNNFSNLKSIYQACEGIGKNFAKSKNLWMTSGKDPYGDADQDIGQAINNIVTIARKAYNQAIQQGMPANGQYGYAGFLVNMDKAIQALEDLGPFPALDPSASNALSDLKQTLNKADSEFVPVGIPGPVQHTNPPPRESIADLEPKDTSFDVPKPEGAAYQGKGADPDKLHEVVKTLLDKNYPIY